MNILSDTNYMYLTYNINLVKQYVQKDDKVKDSSNTWLEEISKIKSTNTLINTCSQSMF